MGRDREWAGIHSRSGGADSQHGTSDVDELNLLIPHPVPHLAGFVLSDAVVSGDLSFARGPDSDSACSPCQQLGTDMERPIKSGALLFLCPVLLLLPRRRGREGLSRRLITLIFVGRYGMIVSRELASDYARVVESWLEASRVEQA